MDFTFLFIVILMLIAVKSNLPWLAGGLFLLLLFSSKNKYFILAAFLGLALMLTLMFVPLGDYFLWVVLGGLFLILIILARKDVEEPTLGYAGGGGYG